MRVAIVAALLASSPALALGQPSAAPASLQSSLNGATAYVYKRASGVELKLWVFSPADVAASESRPAIVFFGGGGWRVQNPAQFSPQARYLASKGMIAIVADYRVRAANNTTPYEAVADAKSAVRWIREHAAELRVRPTSIAASGGSAGGHIALATAVANGFDEAGENASVSSKPNALVLFNPPTDLVRDGRAARAPQLQALVTQMGPRSREISPLHQLAAGLPPTIILHGTADTTVPYSDSEAFCRKATELRNRCELVGYDGAPHGFFNPGNSVKWYEETLSGAERFLKSLGYIR